MRILYVEDNETNQALVERVMRAKQHTILFRDEGEGALELLANDAEIDLILLDIELAGAISGVEVVKTLRGRNDKRPVVAVTAYAMMGDRERILAAGCDQYLPKPLNIADLIKVLDHYEGDIAARKAGLAVPAFPPITATPIVSEDMPPVPATPPAPSDVSSAPAPAAAESVPAAPPQPPATDTSAPMPPPAVPATEPATVTPPTALPAAPPPPTPVQAVVTPTAATEKPSGGDSSKPDQPPGDKAP